MAEPAEADSIAQDLWVGFIASTASTFHERLPKCGEWDVRFRGQNFGQETCCSSALAVRESATSACTSATIGSSTLARAEAESESTICRGTTLNATLAHAASAISSAALSIKRTGTRLLRKLQLKNLHLMWIQNRNPFQLRSEQTSLKTDSSAQKL